MSKKNNNATRFSHAIVIGSSIAGMLTARVLANHADRVTVIERDRLPDTPAFRKGAPHARHPHGLLMRGQQIMEGYFPDLTAELHANGALPLNMGRDVHIYMGGAPVVEFDTELTVTGAGRPLLENTIYRRLRRNPKVVMRDACNVIGLLTSENGSRVTGIRLQERGVNNASMEELTADLVIDASGRTSKLPVWLKELGYDAPEEITIDARAGYSTQMLRPHNPQTARRISYCIPQAPHQSRGAIVIPLEDGRVQLTLTGFNGDYPPTDPAAFRDFARSLPVSDFYAALTQAEPEGTPYAYRGIANRLRKYEALDRRPDGILAIGDAVYAFNPVYGQGMTVAALGAEALDQRLAVRRTANGDYRLPGLPGEFQKTLAKIIAGPWQMATGQDLRWPAAAEGHTIDPVTRLVQRYFDRVLDAMTASPEVAEAFSYVQNMLKPPTTLFHPRIVYRVLRHRPPTSARAAESQGNTVLAAGRTG